MFTQKYLYYMQFIHCEKAAHGLFLTCLMFVKAKYLAPTLTSQACRLSIRISPHAGLCTIMPVNT